MSTHQKISRRTWLKGMALFSAAAGLIPPMLASTAADAKASKAGVHYRDYPKGDANVPHVQILHGGKRQKVGRDVHGRLHDGNDGSRSLPSGRRQDQPDGLV
jgi:hypothetical protein